MALERRTRAAAILANVLIALYLIFTFFPFYWLIVTSLKKPVDAFAIPPAWIFKPIIGNYAQLLQMGFIKSYLNNIIVGLLATLASLVLGIPAGYSMARAKFRGMKFMRTWILISRLAPPVAFVIPMYMIFRQLHLIDTFLGLVISYLTVTLPFVVWIMSGFFQGVPQDMEEAAIIDGCTRVGALLRVVLPISTPGIATATVFAMIMAWNQYFYPLVLGGRRVITAPVLISGFLTFDGPNWGKLAAGGVVVVAPVLIFTLLAQKGLVRGLLGGAIK
jgi:multiple sugar transport system permease protein